MMRGHSWESTLLLCALLIYMFEQKPTQRRTCMWENERERKMEFGKRRGGGEEGQEAEVRLLIEGGEDDGFASTSAFGPVCLCRICHEEEEESSTSMESPCACSGTLKFAHRECIQRWCDEKGSIVCEICLQAFEPGYTIPEKKALVDVGVTIRGSLEVPRVNYDPQNPEYITSSNDGLESDYAECAPSSQTSAKYRSVALAVTVLLLIRHLVAVVSVGADQYAFTLVTVYLLRASGILLPFYLVMRFIKEIQQSQRLNQLQQIHEEEGSASIHDLEEDDVEQHAIQVR